MKPRQEYDLRPMPYYPDPSKSTHILGPKPGGNPFDTSLVVSNWWRTGISLRALCTCGAERQVPTVSIIALLGDGHHFDEARDLPRVANALRCGTCGEKGRATVRLVRG